MNALDGDASGELSRLGAVKSCISDIIFRGSLYGRGRLGIVIFGGGGRVLVPLCDDYTYFTQMLSVLGSDFISDQSTDLVSGLELALSTFEEEMSNRHLIILTDGEHYGGDYNEVLSRMREQDVMLSVVGVGNESGARIPLGDGKYLSDISGRDVITYLDKSTLSKLSSDYFMFPLSYSDIERIVPVYESPTPSLFSMQNILLLIVLLLLFIYA